MYTSGYAGRASAYQSVQAWSSTARDPRELIVMLYDGALERIAQARGCIEHGRIADKLPLLSRSIAIVDELRGSLDLARGGPIAANLDELYAYASRRLVEANALNKVEILDEVTGLLRELRQGWAAIAAEHAAPPAA